MYDYQNMQRRAILIVDYRSFYASCSAVMLGLDPLKVKLAVVSDRNQDNSVVLAATPALKKMGIKQGCRRWEIPNRRDIIVVNPSMAHYVQVSHYIASRILLSYVAPEDYSPLSIDEAFLDVQASYRLFASSPEELAQLIQRRILQETGISSTTGLGDNLLLAKQALDREAKKNASGLAYWRYEDIPHKHWKLPIGDLYGVGGKTEEKLKRRGVYTVGGLAKCSLDSLVRQFGKVQGTELHLHAWGIDDSRISEKYEPKSQSVGSSQILHQDYRGRAVEMLLLEMLEEVAYRMRQSNRCCLTLQLSVGYNRVYGGGFQVSRTLEAPTNLTDELYGTLLELFREKYRGEPVRSVGISLARLVGEDEEQLSFFRDEESRQKKIQLTKAVDEIRSKFGKNSLLRAISYVEQEGMSMTIRERNQKLGGHKA